MEWPKGEAQPTKYWLSTLSAEISLTALVRTAKHRWIIERDYEELKQELGLGHFEGRGWRGNARISVESRDPRVTHSTMPSAV